MSEERRIAWMAQEHGVRFIPHGWNTAVGLAADLQLASAFPEPIWWSISPARPLSTKSPRAAGDSTRTACSRSRMKPGLGIEIDLGALSEYSRTKIAT